MRMPEQSTQNTYAFVIDGEAVFTMSVPVNNDLLNAILSSNPTIVPVPQELVADITEGIMTGEYWKFDEVE